MNKQQVEWASKHDWFISALATLTGTFVVYARPDVADVPDLFLQGEIAAMRFFNFQELKAWAGY